MTKTIQRLVLDTSVPLKDLDKAQQLF
jgi:hypothetical protein